MSTAFPFSPVGFADFSIIQLNLDYRHADEEHIDERNALKFNMSADCNRAHEEDGGLSCACILSINCELLGPGDKDAKPSLGTIDISLRVTCFSQFPDDMDEDTCWELLENNAITHLYSRARVYLEVLTSSCPGGVFSLPVINPIEFMDRFAAQDTDEE